jgi:hypothetical protein
MLLRTESKARGLHLKLLLVCWWLRGFVFDPAINAGLYFPRYLALNHCRIFVFPL